MRLLMKGASRMETRRSTEIPVWQRSGDFHNVESVVVWTLDVVLQICEVGSALE